ncbi:uncharacterized protein LAESUDRAFT_725561 [Laetiporus sulphureus 93-53]|uniref:PH domain-containing protein n=1 Tax=Laetiporus sulphureus 93-53 TaxID=1314785 RepID=A0A165EDF9_9APHY|nr:uncharacterized protein LAESUDRAFT_725561 [Laetiporus sulphureus 93-53]KZT06798.1 hypothetical protein LAESUDRAFT_725561 [Laetiporus sulphureus 93-53]
MQQHHASPRPPFGHSGPSGIPGDQIICKGWVLKKRRKKMQGFARRYFTLQQSGWLSYSFEPGQPSRDQVFLPQAAICSTPGRKDIHIDSGNATFHIKCLSEQDFDMWMAAFRKFLARDGGQSAAPTLGRRTTVRSSPRPMHYNRVGALVDEMGNTITEMQEALTTLQDEEAKQRANSIRSEKDKKERTKEHGAHVFGIFKKAAPHHNNGLARSSTTETSSDTSSATGSTYNRLQAALETLRHQHSALVKALPGTTSLDTHSVYGHTLSHTPEEDGERTPTTAHSMGRKLGRMSMLSTHSGGSNSVWFDAQEGDGAEEFVVDASPGESGPSSSILDLSSQSTSNQADTGSSTDTSADTDAGSEISSETSEEELAGAVSPEPETGKEERQIVRRTHLPSGPVGDEVSLFAVLKKNVGKDLSQVAMPVSFNEPLTLLQKIAEELEYFDLLSRAAQEDDSVLRMCYVASFAVSTYANTKYRTGRKGFNPMLAETFEEPRMMFVAEKVSHNPVVLAYHAEGEGWELWATSTGKTKFWGKSLEIIPQGTIHLRLGDEQYEWTRPSSFMRNIMMGTKYLEHCGKMTIENTDTGLRCNLEFKEGGYWGPSNIVSGAIVSASGKTETHLEGKWDEQMVQKLNSSHLRVLWKLNPFPKNAPDYYGFTSFGITLNEITPDLEGHLPPTDSRYRTDVRALEEGDIDRAEAEKQRIEELQRERRRRGADRKPRWFKQVGDNEWEFTGEYWHHREQGWKDIEPLW